jgi:hypothetical protein
MDTVDIQAIEIHNCIQKNRVQGYTTMTVNHFQNINWSAFNWKRTDIDAQLWNTLIILFLVSKKYRLHQFLLMCLVLFWDLQF